MISRRSFLKAAGIAGMAALGAATLTACGESRGAAPSSGPAADEAARSVSASASATPESTSASESASSATTSASTANAAASIVVYFSRAGENYGVGVVEQGNTAILAEMIADKTGSDTFEIAPATAYSEDYDECCDVALDEQNASARPAYSGDVDLSPYKTVYLGYPIWWGDLPMCVYTFLEAHDWARKNVRPFLTHAGSGVSGTDAKLSATCDSATIGEPLSMAGTTAQDDRAAAEFAVDAWLG